MFAHGAGENAALSIGNDIIKAMHAFVRELSKYRNTSIGTQHCDVTDSKQEQVAVLLKRKSSDGLSTINDLMFRK
jgi:hypothetical protein